MGIGDGVRSRRPTSRAAAVVDRERTTTGAPRPCGRRDHMFGGCRSDWFVVADPRDLRLEVAVLGLDLVVVVAVAVDCARPAGEA